jgi:hypothetical protein
MFFDTTVFNATVLRERPNDFIIGCQPLIAICVRYYIQKKMFSLDEKHDLIQSVNERLIMQMPKISEQYNGSSTLDAYMSVVIRNICLKIHRDDPVPPAPAIPSDGTAAVQDEPFSGLFIRQEVDKLRTILILLYRKRNKFILCAKYYYRLPVTENDIRRAFPSIHFNDINTLIAVSASNSEQMHVEEIFTILAQCVLKYEGTMIDRDSLRRWTVRTINSVIRQLNGDPPESAHTADTLKELIDEYCHSEYYS